MYKRNLSLHWRGGSLSKKTIKVKTWIHIDALTPVHTLVQCHNTGKSVLECIKRKPSWHRRGGACFKKVFKVKTCLDQCCGPGTPVQCHNTSKSVLAQHKSASRGNRVGIGVVGLAQGSQLVPCSCYFSWHVPSTSPHHHTLLLLIVMRIGSVSDLKTHSGEKSHFSWHLPSSSPYHWTFTHSSFFLSFHFQVLMWVL